MASIHRYRVYCTTEGSYQYVWSESAPSRCPNDASHVIDPAASVVVQSVTEQNVYMSGKAFTGSKGYYMMQGATLAIDQGVETQDHTFKLPSCVYGLTLVIRDENIGDSVDVIVAPDTVVGWVTASADAGASTIHVSETVAANVMEGFYVAIDGGVDLGMVVSVDRVGGTLTLETPAPSPVVAGALLEMSIYIAKDLPLAAPGPFPIGYGTMAGKPVPAGTRARLRYRNDNGAAKSIAYFYEFTY